MLGAPRRCLTLDDSGARGRTCARPLEQMAGSERGELSVRPITQVFLALFSSRVEVGEEGWGVVLVGVVSVFELGIHDRTYQVAGGRPSVRAIAEWCGRSARVANRSLGSGLRFALTRVLLPVTFDLLYQ